MTFDQIVADHQMFFGVLGSVTFVNGVLAYKALFRLRREQPTLLQAAGIIKVDGGFRCSLGIARLGYGSVGDALPLVTRGLFKGMVVHYVWLWGLMFAVLTGFLKI